MNLPRAAVRLVRAGLVMVVLVASALGLSAAPARASASGIFVACGYGGAVAVPVSIGSGCMSLPDAITAAEAYGNAGTNATIEMMPGSYCPIDIPSAFDNLTFLGVGMAGVDLSGGPVVITGPEAAMSTFEYSGAHCGAAVSNMVQASAGYFFDAHIDFENLAIDGTGGPAYGMYFVGENLNLRDVLIQNSSTLGVYYQAGQQTDIQASNSAFLNNANGIEVVGEGAIDESTMAGNTGLGVEASNVDLHLDNDTIAHNGHGIVNGNFGDTIQLANSIVADDTGNDCSGVALGINGDLEPNGANGGNGNNLFGDTSCNTGDLTDIAIDTDTIAATDLNGGPTPSILPPFQAQGTAVAGYCTSTTTDQREFLVTGGASCDIGAVDTNASGTIAPLTAQSSLDFGTVPTNQPSTEGVTVYNNGGDVMGITGADITGAPYTISTNGCTYDVLLHQRNTTCFVNVQAAPTTQTETDGTLTIHTSGGDLAVPLTVTGGPPLTKPSPPTGVHGSAGNKRVSLSWTAPADDGGQAVDFYTIRYSANGGTTWTTGPTSFTTSKAVTGLTNGKAYVFEVNANNDFDTSDYSTASVDLTPHTASDTSSLTTPVAKRITFGASATLSTTLTDSVTHADIVGASVTLLSRAGSTGVFTSGPSGTTDSHGVVSLPVHPKVNTQYKWSFAGTSGHAARTTPEGTVSVTQVVSAALSASSVHHGKVVKIFGTVSPNETGRVVVLQRLVAGKWKNLTVTAKIKRQVLPNHKKVIGYVLSYTPTGAGKETVRVSRAPTSSNAAGVSKRLALTVT